MHCSPLFQHIPKTTPSNDIKMLHLIPLPSYCALFCPFQYLCGLKAPECIRIKLSIITYCCMHGATLRYPRLATVQDHRDSCYVATLIIHRRLNGCLIGGYIFAAACPRVLNLLSAILKRLSYWRLSVIRSKLCSNSHFWNCLTILNSLCSSVCLAVVGNMLQDANVKG